MLRFEMDSANVFVPDGGHNVTDPSLPEQLWPYRADRIEADGPPSAGVWRRHQLVYARSNASTEALGWECVSAGKPGTWRAITSGAARTEGCELVGAIERLARLRAAGALSEAEFVRGKAAVMLQYEAQQ